MQPTSGSWPFCFITQRKHTELSLHAGGLLGPGVPTAVNSPDTVQDQGTEDTKGQGGQGGEGPAVVAELEVGI